MAGRPLRCEHGALLGGVLGYCLECGADGGQWVRPLLNVELALDLAEKERDELRATVEAMRPVVEAAYKWRGSTRLTDYADRVLEKVVDNCLLRLDRTKEGT